MADAINLANKYEKKLDERFKQSSLTNAYAGDSYSFSGTKSITVYSVGSTKLNDYDRTKTANRFGTPNELGDTTQTLVMNEDKGYAFTIDAGNANEQFNIKHCNAQLKSIWDEEVVPYVDRYRFTHWANGAGVSELAAAALTDKTVLRAVLLAHAKMNNNRVPKGKHRAVFISETLAVECKLAEQLRNNNMFTSKAIINGQIGDINGSPIIAVPDDLLPTGVDFLIKYKNASVDPLKRKVLRVHLNPPGLDGDLGEGRIIHDSFVLDNKVNGLYVHATSSLCAMPTITVSSGSATMEAGTGEAVKYTTDGTNPKTSSTALVYNAESKPTVESGDTIKAFAYKAVFTNSGITTFKVS